MLLQPHSDKIVKRILHIILIITFTQSVFGQNIPLEDFNFAQKLCSDYPSLMTPDCSMLDTVEARMWEPLLDVRDAGITSMEEIVRFRRIDTILASGNQMTRFIDQIRPGVFWTLSYLDLSDNLLDTLPHISINPDFHVVQYMFFQNNRVRNIQRFWSVRDTIIILNVANNYLTEIEDFSMAKLAQKIDLSGNYFTFEDLIPQTNHPQFASVFTVSPQKDLPWAHSDTTLKEHQSFVMDMAIDAGVAGNTYRWFKDGELVETTSVSYLTFDSLRLEDAGVYRVEVTNANPLLSHVVLRSEAFTLNVEACMDISGVKYFLSPKCYGGDLELYGSTVEGGVPPYTIYLEEGNTNTPLTNVSPVRLLKGEYLVKVQDGLGCEKQVGEPLVVLGRSNCDEYVITPDGDGVQDVYYFEGVEDVKVYNQSGAMIKQMTLPHFWDGTDNSGSLLPPGKYVMILEGNEKIDVKLIW